MIKILFLGYSKKDTRLIDFLKSKKNIRRICSGNGLSPKFYDNLIGKKCPIDITKGEPVRKNIINKISAI